MEDVTSRPSIEYIPPLPPKVKQRGSTTFTTITTDDVKSNGYEDGRNNMESLSSMHSHVLNTKSSSATVFIAATQSDRPAITPSTDALNGPHVVTIRINTDADKPKPKISSVHLKSDVDFDSFKINDLYKKNSLVRLNVDDRPKIIENEDILKTDKAPYIYCNSYMNSMTNMVMSSGQCSPSDTLDSGTCSDLDGTPPPLPKKKTSKSSAKKAISVTMINSRNGSSQSELDFEDNDSNISCDSLNSSELNSVHADESHGEYKKEKSVEPPVAPAMPSFAIIPNKNGFLPQGLLQDIRDRSAKLSTVETESESSEQHEEACQNINDETNISKESAQLTSFRLVSQLNSEQRSSDSDSLPSLPSLTSNTSKTSIICESTYEDRKQDKMKQELCYSSHYFDTDKFYDFHLNEKQFDETVKSVSVKSESDVPELEFFAGIKDYKNEDAPSTIRSSKGTIRGVKNRVRAGIATFLQMQTTTKVT
ncbi:Glutaredoxin domain-containing cysteine-rich protein [Operophtera brumata]|uniref:Glutaredoxin domain-containing cysteine-rich protein n=1 Tax=Operophtera brumata TaxID=104452 RepID=A0A0L7LU64_OPEBR|nr:Glutaredoxin domain-containing cysteine-rich protein [Operophtera brumata]